MHMMGSLDALPSITRVDVPRVTSGTILVQTSPPRLGGPETIASPRAPRPRAPRARLAPKWLSSASASPSKGLSASQASAMRARGMPWWRLTVSRLRPVGEAAESAVASARNSLGSSPNLRSERCDFVTYLFFGAFLLPMA